MVTKIITKRLSPFLDELIEKNQSVFIPGRQIIDNIVAVKELVHSMNNSDLVLGSFSLKLDMSISYDRVHWGFLSMVLHSFGITGSIHSLIMNSVQTTSFSVLLNGQPEGFFEVKEVSGRDVPFRLTYLYYDHKV